MRTILLHLLFSVSSLANVEVFEPEHFYVGEVYVKKPDGKVVDTRVIVAKRTLLPVQNQILEQGINFPKNGPLVFFETTTQVHKGNRFNIVDKSLTVAGAGEFLGEAWKWKGWKYKAKFKDGSGSMLAETMIDNEVLKSRKKHLDSDGNVQYLYEQTLHPISRAAFDALMQKLVPKN